MSKTPSELSRQADHIWHVWMNEFSKAEREAKRPWPHSLYEFKSLLDFLQWGGKRIEDAFTGKLDKTHKPCSYSPTEPIKENRLKCCLGVDVTGCPILASLKATFDEQRQRECGSLGKFYDEVPDSEMYHRMANTCAWHIYKGVTQGSEGFHGIDTTEGHLMDVGDRMFWDRVYDSMRAGDPEDEGDAPETAPASAELNSAGQPENRGVDPAKEKE